MMKLIPTISFAAGIMFFAAGVFPVAAQPSNAVSTAPVYVPDYSHAGESLPNHVLAWDAVSKEVTLTNGQEVAQFTFDFTNVAPGNVTILAVQPSCGCTTAELPPVPWTLPPETGGQIKLSVNLQAKSGTVFKNVNVTTDRGQTNLTLRITIPPPPVIKQTESNRARGLAMAKVDRQAVFKGDCVSCHAKNIEGKYGQDLFTAVCAVCHEAEPRATMVPDLHSLPVPTNEEFWRTWIAAGKAGTLMPAFATSQGGPLNDMQIASLAAYLNAVIPPKAVAPTPASQ